MALSSLVERDRACIWHPFTQMQTASQIPIIQAKGPYLYSEEGRRYLDGISSWWVNLHGHTHPYMVQRIKSQVEQLEHVIFAGFTHAPAVTLAERLLKILPGNMSKIFYSDNGSTAVEVALKMALQYWSNQGIKKSKVLCLKNSYHGDTFGAMSAAGKNCYNRPFWNHLFEVERIDPDSSTQLKEAACFIFEPLVLAAGGMILYEAQKLDALLRLCRQADVLTIADEVMTGFGRTGTLFACDQLQEKPDLICLSKGLTGGFLPLGATACTQRIYEAFLGDSLSQALLHGHSYTANPIACSSALASLDLLEKPSCLVQRNRIAEQHVRFCKAVTQSKLVRCQSLGTLLVTEFADKSREQLYTHFLEREILLRPIGQVLYVLPPYCIEEAELNSIYEAIYDLFD